MISKFLKLRILTIIFVLFLNVYQVEATKKLVGKFGTYHFGSKLIYFGSGGRLIYEGTNENGQRVAIKRIPPEQAALSQEIDIIQKLNGHPNIVRLIEIVKNEEQKLFHELDDNLYEFTYIVMEFCANGDLFSLLEQRIKERKLFDENTTKQYLEKIIKTVSFMHEQHVLHFDLKLENILMNDAGELKLTDFGLSYDLEKFGESEESMPYGTTPYMPPPNNNNTISNGKKADVWSLGVILHLLLFGTYPYDEYFKQKNTYFTCRFYDCQFCHVSEDAKDLIHKMLDWDPKKRIELSDILKHPWLSTWSRIKRFFCSWTQCCGSCSDKKKQELKQKK
jgi:serine/threonine protein kinase